jgi:hypothetical protein
MVVIMVIADHTSDRKAGIAKAIIGCFALNISSDPTPMSAVSFPY